nr:methylglyoxal synthase [uncultured Gemmiger sp.]
MRIALIAHDSRKELMAQFCTAYIRILSQNELVATGVTGKVVHDATGLPVRCLYPGGRGGAEQISSMIACGEVDMLLFFRDPVSARPDEPNAVNLLRLCDMHTIPVATNIATAEVLIHGLERGDLAWIDLQRDRRS